MHKYLRLAGWNKSNADPNLYILCEGGLVVILMVYVDDLYLTGNAPAIVQEIKHQHMKQYEMTHLGPITKYLGLEFTKLGEGVFIHQRSYILRILHDFDMTAC